jgi:hypothetical protein
MIRLSLYYGEGTYVNEVNFNNITNSFMEEYEHENMRIYSSFDLAWKNSKVIAPKYYNLNNEEGHGM